MRFLWLLCVQKFRSRYANIYFSSITRQCIYIIRWRFCFLDSSRSLILKANYIVLTTPPSPGWFWLFTPSFSPLHTPGFPFFEEKCIFFEKSLENVWWVMKKSVPLHSLSEREMPAAHVAVLFFWLHWELWHAGTEVMAVRSVGFACRVTEKLNQFLIMCQFFGIRHTVNARYQTKQFSILQWRVWSWLRMNASYRLNTCKSRGNGDGSLLLSDVDRRMGA